MLVVSNSPARDATSTALVHPTPFGSVPPSMPPTFAQPTLSRRTKLLLAGAGLTLLAAIATIAIMKGAESKGAEEPSGADTGSDGESGPESSQSAVTPDPAKPDPVKVGQGDPPRPDPTKPEPAVKQDPPRPEPAIKQDPPRPEPTVKQDPPRPEPTVKQDPPRPEPTVKQDPPRPEPVRTDPKRNTRAGNSRAGTQSRKQQVAAATSSTAATASRPDVSGVRSRALDLYRQKKFREAAAVLNQAAAALSGRDAAGLRTTASVYAQLGAAYNRGTSPGAKPTDSYRDLRTALNIDSGSAGGELTSEIKGKLAQIAPKAAMSFYVRKEYAEASAAVKTAEANGISNDDTKLVRTKLEQAARELYEQAAKEIESDPDAAKQKLRQIKSMVDGKSPTLVKATTLLNAN
jgi:outer membrane biosynthesis protein TonB